MHILFYHISIEIAIAFLKKVAKKRSLTVKLSSRKEIRHRTTLPQSNMQYHRRWAPYRSCSGWERELQARHGHRKKRIKDARFMSVELCRNDKQFLVNWEIAILY